MTDVLKLFLNTEYFDFIIFYHAAWNAAW